MAYNATFNLRGKKIQDTYQQMTQYDTGSKLFYDGQGFSMVTTASYAPRAGNADTAVSASHANLADIATRANTASIADKTPVWIKDTAAGENYDLRASEVGGAVLTFNYNDGGNVIALISATTAAISIGPAETPTNIYGLTTVDDNLVVTGDITASNAAITSKFIQGVSHSFQSGVTRGVLEGSQNTIFSSTDSHVEGSRNTVAGNRSHAEGYSCSVVGNQSHAEGEGCIVVGAQGHAEGGFTRVNGTAGHAEGFHTLAAGAYSHAQGAYTTASGQSSTAIGQNITVAGARSVGIQLDNTSGSVVGTSGMMAVMGGIVTVNQLVPSGWNRLEVAGNISCSVITASFAQTTASWALNCFTASYAISTSIQTIETQSLVSVVSASWASSSVSASWAPPWDGGIIHITTSLEAGANIYVASLLVDDVGEDVSGLLKLQGSTYGAAYAGRIQFNNRTDGEGENAHITVDPYGAMEISGTSVTIPTLNTSNNIIFASNVMYNDNISGSIISGSSISLMGPLTYDASKVKNYITLEKVATNGNEDYGVLTLNGWDFSDYVGAIRFKQIQSFNDQVSFNLGINALPAGNAFELRDYYTPGYADLYFGNAYASNFYGTSSYANKALSASFATTAATATTANTLAGPFITVDNDLVPLAGEYTIGTSGQPWAGVYAATFYGTASYASFASASFASTTSSFASRSFSATSASWASASVSASWASRSMWTTSASFASASFSSSWASASFSSSFASRSMWTTSASFASASFSSSWASASLSSSWASASVSSSVSTFVVGTLNTMNYATTISVDFNIAMFHSSSLSNNVYLDTTNKSVGKMTSLKLYAESSDKIMTYPASWVWLGEVPRILSASKVGIISLTCYGTTDADVVGIFAAQL